MAHPTFSPGQKVRHRASGQTAIVLSRSPQSDGKTPLPDDDPRRDPGRDKYGISLGLDGLNGPKLKPTGHMLDGQPLMTEEPALPQRLDRPYFVYVQGYVLEAAE